MRVGSLCTGYGGLDLAVEEVFGARTAWASDLDPGASKIIQHRIGVPNLGDLTLVDWSTVEPIDILTAGWPCQPFSQAGKQKGADDHRAIWPAIARAVRDLRPRYVVLENVSAIATARTGPELARAAASLAALGYVGSWLCLRASDIGAPHRRERIFIVAADSRRLSGEPGGLAGPRETASRGARGEFGRRSDGSVALLPTPKTTDAKVPSAADANRNDPGLRALPLLLPTPTAMNPNDGESVETWEARRQATLARVGNGNGFGTPLAIAVQPLPTPRATDGTKGGPNQRGSSGDLMLPSAVVSQFSQYAEAVARWEPIVGRPAPDPTVPGAKGGRRLNPAFVEWMMGLPAGWVTDVPGLTRAAQLKALGNGVVPQQAAAAIATMLGLEEEETAAPPAASQVTAAAALPGQLDLFDLEDEGGI